MLRRKRLPEELVPAHAAFEAVLDELEPGKSGLADVLPGTRMPGRPLHDALAEYARRLDAAAPLMPAWRAPAVEAEWVACRDGLAIARARATTAIDAVDPPGFEALLGLVSSLMDPLDPFADAEERFRRLRR